MDDAGYIPEETEAIEETAAAFEEWTDEEINLTTNVITWDQVFEQWQAAIQGQNTPNVSEMANEHAVDYGSSGVVRPNTELFEQYDDWYDTPSFWGTTRATSGASRGSSRFATSTPTWTSTTPGTTTFPRRGRR